MNHRTLPQKCALARGGKLRAGLAGLLLIPLLLLAVDPCHADDAANQAARELARKLAGQLDPKQSLRIELRDLTGEVSSADFASARNVFENELRSHGFHMADAKPGEVQLAISLSKTPQERLWIAESATEGKARVTIVTFAKGPETPPASELMPEQIQAQRVFDQSDPILDFAVLKQRNGDPTEIAILGIQSIEVLGQVSGRWQKEVSVTIPWRRPPSRDARGRITIIDSQIIAQAEGTTCVGDVGNFNNLHCDMTPEGAVNSLAFWGPGESRPGVLALGRNWIETAKPPDMMYSIAGFDSGGNLVWVTTGGDGYARFSLQASGELLGKINGWGSDLATTQTNCGVRWQILASRARDYTEKDAVTAFEWRDRAAHAVSAPLELGGAVTALWPDREFGPARAVIRDIRTGKYEAYLFSVTCSR